jgi:integrase
MKAHIVLNSKYGTWNLRWKQDGVRKTKQLGTLRDWATREEAEKANAALLRLYNQDRKAAPTVRELVKQFMEEKMSKRFSTRLAHQSRLENHILPKWGNSPITELKARPVELWLTGLNLRPKTLVHIRGLIRQLWDYAMWLEAVPEQRNPMELVSIKGATNRKKPISLTEDQFRKFLAHLEEPVRTLALLCVSFGLRISEALALKWSDVDWLRGTLAITKGIVRQRVDDVKTRESKRTMSIDAALLEVLKAWKQVSSYQAEGDWIFASPMKKGALPISYPHVFKTFHKAAREAELEAFGTHTMRHTYRSWLDALGTALSVQQKLMRHADIRTTMNVYGDVVTDEMREAHSKVVRMALAN